MSAEPLTREERDAYVADWWKSLNEPRFVRHIVRYEATVRAAEDRAERLRKALDVCMKHAERCQNFDARDVHYYVCAALAADDAARGES